MVLFAGASPAWAARSRAYVGETSAGTRIGFLIDPDVTRTVRAGEVVRTAHAG